MPGVEAGRHDDSGGAFGSMAAPTCAAISISSCEIVSGNEAGPVVVVGICLAVDMLRELLRKGSLVFVYDG